MILYSLFRSGLLLVLLLYVHFYLFTDVSKNCSVRDQLLSFYMKNVFGGLSIGSDKVYIVSAFQTLQENLSNCVSIFFEKKNRYLRKDLTLAFRIYYRLGEKGIYKAISELDILLHWIQTYIETIK
uniref:Interleukin family protein n=1 Tax=Gopherus agassizii TaxID=38772 RepID=A0A452HGB5_9SAUR